MISNNDERFRIQYISTAKIHVTPMSPPLSMDKLLL